MSLNDSAMFDRLITFLNTNGATYRVLEHAPEGRTEIVSAYRHHAIAAAAKCIMLMVKIGKKVTKHVLAVVPGDMRVDLPAVKSLFGGTYISFAATDVAERLAGSVTGTILPFSFSSDVELIADPSLLGHAELYFNAARLDRSIALRTTDYIALARPRLAQIATAG